MKRVVSMLLVMLLLFSTVSMAAEPVVVAITEEDIAAAIREEVESLDQLTRQEMVDYLLLYEALDNSADFFNAYWDGFVILASRFEDYKDINYDISQPIFKTLAMTFVITLINLSNDDEHPEYSLENMFGYNEASGFQANELEDFLLQADITEAVRGFLEYAGYGVNDLQHGIDFLARGFSFVNDFIASGTPVSNDYGKSVALFYGDYVNHPAMSINNQGVTGLINYFNNESPVDVSEQFALDQLGIFMTYYNGLSSSNTDDQALIYDYLNKYGFLFVRVDTPVIDENDDNGGTRTIIYRDAVVPEEEIFELTTVPLSAFYPFSDMSGHLWARTAAETLFMYYIVNGTTSPSFTETDVEVSVLAADNTVGSRAYKVRYFAGDEGIFSPNNMVTRAEFAAMLVRMMNIDDEELVLDPTADDPTDVESDKWYYDEVMYAYDQGYLIYRDAMTQNIDPNEQITREEIAYAISVILEEHEISVTDNEVRIALSKFMDAGDISSDMEHALGLVINQGIVQGSGTEGEYYIYPQDNATRAESVVMLYRMAELIDTRVYINPPEDVAAID